jgi:uncharacterized protein (TIGR00290 family)
VGYISSWSGGKDSCFACYQAILAGYDIFYLANFVSVEYKRVRFHGTDAKLIQLQAEAIGIPLFQKETTGSGFEQEVKAAIGSLIPEGIEGVICGDIYLEENKALMERICGDLEIKLVEPPWGKVPEKILLDFMNSGFEATVVSADSNLFDKEWIGRKVHRDFLKYLKDKNIDICGENGEYHTFVTCGPLFNKKINITSSRIIKRDSFWFLDILEYT